MVAVLRGPGHLPPGSPARRSLTQQIRKIYLCIPPSSCHFGAHSKHRFKHTSANLKSEVTSVHTVKKNFHSNVLEAEETDHAGEELRAARTSQSLKITLDTSDPVGTSSAAALLPFTHDLLCSNGQGGKRPGFPESFALLLSEVCL